MTSPENDVDRLQPGGDVRLGDLWGVGLQQVRFGGFYVRDRRCQSLPEAQQVVNTVGGKLPVLGDTRGQNFPFTSGLSDNNQTGCDV